VAAGTRTSCLGPGGGFGFRLGSSLAGVLEGSDLGRSTAETRSGVASPVDVATGTLTRAAGAARATATSAVTRHLAGVNLTTPGRERSEVGSGYRQA